MMHIDWKKELGISVSRIQASEPKAAYIFPPSSLICIVTTASPIQTRAKTPEKTTVFWSPDVGIDSSKLRSKQNISGPLHGLSAVVSLVAADTR
jgi:hypothetical protein